MVIQSQDRQKEEFQQQLLVIWDEMLYIYPAIEDAGERFKSRSSTK